MNTRNNKAGCARTGKHKWRVNLEIALLSVLSQNAFAGTQCELNFVSAINFGNYDVFSSSSNNYGVGNLTIRCVGNASVFLVTLSSGQSNSYVSRAMRSGANILNYNIYNSAARIIVWGDGTGGTGTMTANRNSTTSLSIFGQIPAGQDVAVGAYSDDVTATIIF